MIESTIQGILFGGSLIDKLVLLVVVILIVSWGWKYVKTYAATLLTKLFGQSTADSITGAIDNAIVTTDEYKARVALQGAASLFEKYGDTAEAETLRSYVVKAVAWSNTTTETKVE